MKTHELDALLQKRYEGSAWAYLPEVRNQTGYSRVTRTADALVMSLWPSRGLDLYGFELKVSRSDWLHELKTPSKADEIAQFCDFWYLVIGDEFVANLEEVPKTWGLLRPTAKGDKLHEVRAPERLTPQPLTKSFIAAALRKATMYVMPEEAIRDKINKARDEGREEGKTSADFFLHNAESDLREAQKAIKDFQEASGIRIDEYHGEQIGKAVKALMEIEEVEHIKRRLNYERNDHLARIDRVEHSLLELEALATPRPPAPVA